jgi:hypothetical protein
MTTTPKPDPQSRNPAFKRLPIDWRPATLEEALQLKRDGYLAVITDEFVLVPTVPTMAKSTAHNS